VAIHGGPYVVQTNIFHWLTYAAMVRDTGATVVVPIYPLAPQGTAATLVPAIADLISSHIDQNGTENVSIYGDAGGAYPLPPCRNSSERVTLSRHAWCSFHRRSISRSVTRPSNRSTTRCCRASRFCKRGIRRSGRPGIIGSTGAVRSRAWIRDFSSTQSTRAFSGGSTYSPTTSRTLSMNCGSLLILNVSTNVA
jgi:hypothetical protein